MIQILGIFHQIQKRILTWQSQRNSRQHRPTGQGSGFTLIELIVASLLVSIVILIAWTGMISALNMSQMAQAKSTRKLELNTTLEIITNEIRQATSINRSGSMIADGSSISVQDVVAHSGLNLNQLGPYGEISLYLEIPTDSNHAACNVGGKSVPAETIDRIVYDIRDSPSEWLSPKVITRYGRIPQASGTIDPCSPPVANDVMADALSNVDEAAACSGVVTGYQGFHTCTQNDQVQLLLKSAIKGLDTTPIRNSITPRNIAFALPSLPTLNLIARNYTTTGRSTTVELDWDWTGASVDERYQKLETYFAKPYEVTIQEKGEEVDVFKVKNYRGKTGYNLKFGFSARPGNACFSVKGKTPDGKKVQSNQVCIVNGVIQSNSDAGQPTTQSSDPPTPHSSGQPTHKHHHHH